MRHYEGFLQIRSHIHLPNTNISSQPKVHFVKRKYLVAENFGGRKLWRIRQNKYYSLIDRHSIISDSFIREAKFTSNGHINAQK